QRNVKRARIAEFVTEHDPEAEKRARIKGTDDLAKSRSRKGRGGGGGKKRMSKSYMEDDSEDGEYETVNVKKIKKKAFLADDDEDLDYGESSDEEDEWEEEKKRRPGRASGRKREEESESEDGEVVFGESDDEDAPTKKAKALLSGRRRLVSPRVRDAEHDQGRHQADPDPVGDLDPLRRREGAGRVQLYPAVHLPEPAGQKRHAEDAVADLEPPPNRRLRLAVLGGVGAEDARGDLQGRQDEHGEAHPLVRAGEVRLPVRVGHRDGERGHGQGERERVEEPVEFEPEPPRGEEGAEEARLDRERNEDAPCEEGHDAVGEPGGHVGRLQGIGRAAREIERERGSAGMVTQGGGAAVRPEEHVVADHDGHLVRFIHYLRELHDGLLAVEHHGRVGQGLLGLWHLGHLRDSLPGHDVLANAAAGDATEVRAKRQANVSTA
ncbi:hypothetical protein THAOC_06228, partial [Thalassiosira oceanica]